MRLIETWLADPERAFDLFAKFPAEETGFENPAAGMNRERFAAYVRGLRDESLGVGLPDGWVPATKYILVNDEGDYVGIFNLRHRLTDFLRNGPGHIGYGVAREYRVADHIGQIGRRVPRHVQHRDLDRAELKPVAVIEQPVELRPVAFEPRARVE